MERKKRERCLAAPVFVFLMSRLQENPPFRMCDDVTAYPPENIQVSTSPNEVTFSQGVHFVKHALYTFEYTAEKIAIISI